MSSVTRTGWFSVAKRYLAKGNQFLVFLEVLNLFLSEVIRDMSVRDAYKPLQGGCEFVYRVIVFAYFKHLVADSGECLDFRAVLI